MKREIKFRAWDNITKSMYGVRDIDYLSNNELNSIRLIVAVQTSDNDIDFDFPIRRNGEYELMQYTGMKDKNGQEIYEGDIVKMYDPYTKTIMTTEVIWDDPNCRFAMKYTFVDFDFLISDEIEVIGNVHENTELLKQEAE